MSAAFTPIPAWPDYAATPDGRVWAVGTNWRGYGARELIPQVNRHGYLRVRLTKDGRRGWFSVHRLVALTLLGPCPEGREHVRHLDGSTTNNAVSNLAWGNAADNAADRSAHGRAAKITPRKRKAMRAGFRKWMEAKRNVTA